MIVTSGSTATLAAHRAGVTTPVVSVGSNPVAIGVADSLARPGGTVTGFALMYDEINVKWLELLREIAGERSHIAVLVDGGSRGSRAQLSLLSSVAPAMGRRLVAVNVDDPDGFEAAFETARHAQALIVLSSPLFSAHKRRIIDLAQASQLPTVYEHRDFTEAGGLISYGPDLRDVFHRAAGYVDRILKGAQPGDLPIEQPTKFELVVNLKTAKALGIEIPSALLARADEVIE